MQEVLPWDLDVNGANKGSAYGMGTLTVNAGDVITISGSTTLMNYVSFNGTSLFNQSSYSFTVASGGSMTFYSQDVNGRSETFTLDITVNTPTVAVTGITLSPTSLSGQVGGSGNLTATVSPSNATDPSVVWSTSNPDVATVVNGYVSYVGVGNATITAKTNDGGKTATCNVTVQAATHSLTVNSGSGSGNYTAGTVVNISANAAPSGKTFDKWTGDVSGVADVNSASTTFTMGSANATITATYKDLPPVTYALTVNSGSGSGNYAAGTVVNISANAAPSGKTFDKWTGDVSGVADVNSASTTFTMGSANATITATYKDLPPVTYALTVNSGSGSGNYAAGTVVNISANAAPSGKTFDKWTGDVSGVADVNSASTTFTMGSANATITATYKDLPPVTYALTVNSGSGSGNYAAGAVVNISANAAPSGKTFDQWTGDVSGVADVNSASTTFTMGSANATITATFKDDDTSIEIVDASKLIVYSQNGLLVIKSDSEPIQRVEIFNLSGQLLRAVQSGGETSVEISSLPQKQALIVKVIMNNGNPIFIRKGLLF